MEQTDVSNPLAPPNIVSHEESINRQPLSNSDFRKLLMTPRPAHSSGFKEPESMRSFSGARSEPRGRPLDPDSQPSGGKQKLNKSSHKRHHGLGRHRKPFSRDEAGQEGSSLYRDRAKERREGRIPDPSGVDGDEADVEHDDEMLMRTADYRAVAPTSAAGGSHAERRREIIKESKYLGGDMEHTHLVKGLDYVLLEKVRMEIQNKEHEAEEALDAELEKPLHHRMEAEDEGPHFHTRIGESIHEVLFKPYTQRIERNEYFLPGRVAYRVDLEDELAEFDVPATVIRSKADCPLADIQESGALTTNDIVVNKLTQIFSYLRAGRRQAKKDKAKQRMAPNDADNDYPEIVAENKRKKPIVNIPIYDNVSSDYVPLPPQSRSGGGNTSHSNNKHSSQTSDRDANRRRTKPSSNNAPGNSFSDQASKSRYFERPEFESGGVDGTEATGNSSISATTDFIRDVANKYGSRKDDEQGKSKASLERLQKKTEIYGYDECYPGFAQSYDAMGDSDDETDFSKMDPGNKKGPLGRWDFETQEEYGEYMSHREAMPKAAFQYGVKKPEGRRTRRIGQPGTGGGGNAGQRNEKTDREWQQIQAIIKRRHQGDDGGGGASQTKNFRK